MARWLHSQVVALGIGALVATLPPASAEATVSTKTVQVQAQVAQVASAMLPLVRLHFSSPVSASALPSLITSPVVATVWQQIGPTTVQAIPTQPVSQTSGYSVTVPVALRCATRCVVLRDTTAQTSFSYSLGWARELLAELNYLPLTFTPSDPHANPVLDNPGTYVWAYPQLPASLKNLWTSGNGAVIVQGAIMNFQNTEGLPTSGLLDSVTWKALVAAVQSHHANPSTYNYVDVTESSPERLTLYVNGVATFHSLVNTGIPQAPTTLGTHPVYLRYQSQTMRGTNPDGTTYNDPGIPWVSYFHGGEALHGYLRSSYGFAQSLGCVEMPFASAGQVWPYTPIGTLVTVRP